MASKDIIVTARAKAFRSEGVGEHRFMVSDDGVRVFNRLDGCYTLVHSLSASAERRIRKLAAEQGSR